MATELGQAYVQIMPSAKGIKGKLQGILDPESKTAGKSAGLNIGSAIKGAIAAAGIGVALKKAITEGGALEQSIGGIETLFKDSAGTVRKYANEAYKTAGVSANDYMEQVTSFSASLLSSLGGDTGKAAESANRAIIDMADNANRMGTPIEEIQRAYQGFAKGNYQMLDNLKLGFAGTKGGMEDLLSEATKLSGVDYNIDSLDDVYSAIHVIQNEMGITGTTAEEAAETIQGSFGAMAAAFQNTMGALAIGENVAGSFKALAETMSTFIFGNLLPMIGTIFQSLPTAVVAFFQTAAPLLITEGGNLIAQLGNGLITAIPQLLMQAQILMSQLILWLREQFPTILQNGVEFILNFANGFLEALPSVITNIGQILNQVLTAIITAIPSVMQSGYDLIVGLAKGIWSNYPEVITRITNILAGLLQTILEHFPGIVRKGMELVGKLAMGIWNNLPQIISTMGNLLTSVIGKIGSYLPKFLNEGLKLIGEMAIGIINAIPGIVAKIPQVIRAMIGAFSGAKSQFTSIGADLIKGLWNGINSVKDWIMGKISGFVDGITGGIKKFFGIKSPSKVMADEIGQWIPAGLAEGIEDNVKPVTDAMNDLTDLTTGTMTSELAMTSSMSLANSTTGGIEVEEGINKQPVHLNLNIGGQVFRAFVENISNEQGRITDLELQF